MHSSSLYNITELVKNEFGFEVELEINIEHYFIRDHIVNRELVISGAFWLECIASVTKDVINEKCDITDLVWLKPILINKDKLRVIVKIKYSPTGFIVSLVKINSERQTEIMHTLLKKCVSLKSTKAKIIPLENIKPQAEIILTHKQIYNEFSNVGFDYGPSYSIVETLWCSQMWSLAQIEFPIEAHQYYLDPGIIDSALQTSLGISFAKNTQDIAHLPFSIKLIRNYQTLINTRYIYVLENNQAKNIRSYHLFFLNAEGEVIVFMQDFVGRRLLN